MKNLRHEQITDSTNKNRLIDIVSIDSIRFLKLDFFFFGGNNLKIERNQSKICADRYAAWTQFLLWYTFSGDKYVKCAQWKFKSHINLNKMSSIVVIIQWQVNFHEWRIYCFERKKNEKKNAVNFLQVDENTIFWHV